MCGSLEIPESNPLFALLRKEKWDRAIKEAKRTPSFARHSFKIGGLYERKISAKVNALHLACMLEAPPEVIQALVAAHPEGAKEVDSRYHRVALHIAVMKGASPKAVNTLLQLAPETARVKDIHGRLALHYAVKEESNGELNARQLIKVYPEGVLLTDTNGFLPLHVACRCGTSLAVIHLLIQTSPESMIYAKTKKGSTPLACARQTNKGDIQLEMMGILERYAEEYCSKETKTPLGHCSSSSTVDGISMKSGLTANMTIESS